MPFHVYVVVNPDNGTYVGQTFDLKARLAEHSDPQGGLTLHTKRRRWPRSLRPHYFTLTTSVAEKPLPSS